MVVAVLLLFCLALLAALLCDISLLWALVFGYVLFFVQARLRGAQSSVLLASSLQGIRTVSSILLVFVCIGMLTASWRACGTIAYLVDASLTLVDPAFFLPFAFALNAALSLLLGSSFATAATMGVLTMSVGNTLQIPPFLSGGAILAGIYVGDRASPLSTSAHLVCTLTRTAIYDNIRRMWRTSWPALLLALVCYALVSLRLHGTGVLPDTTALFAREYALTPLLALPAALALFLALARVGVCRVMLASTLLALVLLLCVQQANLSGIPHLLVFGYAARNPEVATLMDGGGITSFATVAGIVCLSSTYVGLFREGRLLQPLEPLVLKLGQRLGAYVPYLCLATLTAMLSCNQALTILLTQQLTTPLPLAASTRAVNLEDSAIVLPALVPWSIACATPLHMVGAPTTSILAAWFLWLLLLTRLFWPRDLRSLGSGNL